MPKETSCCFTGHRIMGHDYNEDVLVRGIKYAISKGIDTFICGGATGFDTRAAICVLNAREEFPHIKLHIYAPCNNQSSKWNEADKRTYEKILALADFVDMPSFSYYDGCMKDRNYKMVDNSSMCICYLNSSRSGTAQTYRYAISQNLKVYNIAGKN